MKKLLIRILLISGYLMPFVFLAMNEDATTGTLWFYLVMIFGFGALCYGCIKTGNAHIVIWGNILSFISSFVFARLFETEKWQYYFKPFSSEQLIIFETIVAFIIQVVFVICFRKANYDKKD